MILRTDFVGWITLLKDCKNIMINEVIDEFIFNLCVIRTGIVLHHLSHNLDLDTRTEFNNPFHELVGSFGPLRSVVYSEVFRWLIH